MTRRRTSATAAFHAVLAIVLRKALAELMELYLEEPQDPAEQLAMAAATPVPDTEEDM